MSSQQRIFNALREAREKLEVAEREKTEPIAIIGMGCRFPGGVDTPEAFWHLLRHGVDAMVEVPADRWDIDAYYDPDPDAPGKMYTRDGGFLSQIDQFDPHFFRISPREAVSIDPQQRLLLEVVWEALENAGQAPDRLRGSRTGFFMGLSWHDYEREAYGLDPHRLDAYAGMGNTQSIAVGRLAYVLGVHGPTMLVDTACSASLVAVHLACQSLRMNEADMVLAGGVNLMISPLSTIFCCKIHALSPTGRCHTFDAAADGYARGEGCGVVVLKRLRDAVANGDHILALIRGSAINHDGPSSGLTVPNRRAQQRVIQQSLANGNVDPLQVSYVETHGTGTLLGDPIEVAALGDALGQDRAQHQPLLIGSVKTNFGHLEAAAGIAGLIKVVLALQHAEIPPHLHFKEPNPNIDWDAFPVAVPTTVTAWPPGRRVAGVSSFGFSGTNAHVVLEAAPVAEPALGGVEPCRHLLVLSAKTDQALRQLAERYAQHLALHPDAPLGDVCFTARIGRAHFDHRLAAVTASPAQLRAQLEAVAAGRAEAGVVKGTVASHKRPKMAFLFTGQGAQYVGMGHELYDTQPTFRRALDRCDALLRPYLDTPLLEVLYAGTAPGAWLDKTAYTQPALFALEYALAEVWRSWGIEPDGVMGHSVGEYVAACVAGVVSLEDGLRLMAERGRLMQALPRHGDMVAVFAAEEQVAAAVQPYTQDVAIAAVNGPRALVISGKREAVQAVRAALQAEGHQTRLLPVSHPFHSPLMEPMLPAFEQVVRGVRLSAPTLSLISNVSGGWATAEITTPAYWCHHVRQPVQFAAGMKTLHQAGYEVFLEVGPQPTLVGMGRHCVPDGAGTWLPSLRRGQSDWQQMLQSLGELYTRGTAIDWAGFDQDDARRRRELPTYPFQRQRYWVETRPSSTQPPVLPQQQRTTTQKRHPLLGRRLFSPTFKPQRWYFEVDIHQDAPAYLADHHIFGMAIPPATMFVEIALAAGMTVFKTHHVILEDVVIQQALILPDQTTTTLQCVLLPEGPMTYAFQIFSLRGGDEPGTEPSWIRHAVGKLTVGDEAPAHRQVDIAALPPGAAQAIAVPTCYQRFQAQGIELGARFQAIAHLWVHEGDVFGDVQLPASVALEAADYVLHPILLDACGQAIASAFPAAHEEAYLPIGLDRLCVYRRGEAHLWFKARIRPAHDSTSLLRIADLQLFNATGALVAEVEGATTRRAEREAVLRELQKDRESWLYEVVWQASPPASQPLSLPETTASSWLIFDDRKGVGKQLGQLLQEKNEPCVFVSASASFEKTGTTQYGINPAEPQHFRQLLQACARDHLLPARGIIYLWGLEEPSEHEPTLTTIQAKQALGCQGALHLVQALLQSGWATYPPLWIVTRGTQLVGAPSTPLNVAQAPLWGLGRVLALEHPELRCRCVDFAPTAAVDEPHMFVEDLGSADPDSHMAYREGVRYAARLARRTAPDAAPQSQRLVHAESSYLITGGLGALGLKVAQWLVSLGARHVVLIGRRAPNRAAQETIRQLEEAGAQVMVLQADVSQHADVARVLETMTASLPPLRGIIHAAGVLEDGVLLQQSWSRFDAVMAPKVAGAWNLHTLTREMALDFFVCFSSAASLLGSRGQGNYAAANAFLDALAHYRRHQGLPGLSMNWGPWADVGMAAEMDDRAKRRMQEQGWEPLSPDQGLRLLGELLGRELSQVGVLPLTWPKFLEQFPTGAIPSYFSAWTAPVASVGPEEPSSVQQGELLQRLRDVPASDHRMVLSEYLQDRVARIVGLAPGHPLPPQQLFSELGLDSLMHMELRNHITTDLDVNIPMAEFITSPNIASLTQLLLEYLALASVTLAEYAALDPDDDEMEEITL